MFACHYLYNQTEIYKKSENVMYLNSLSESMLQIIGEEDLSYESVAERCGLSVRFIGKVIRKKAVPSLNSFEKICNGFDRTPNDLLKIQSDYMIPLKVINGAFNAALCPRCNKEIDRIRQSYCGHCGQRLDWRAFDKKALAYSSK